MKKRKLIYVYTNEMDIIQRIETSSIDVPFNEYLIPEDQGSEFLELKEQWDLAYGHKPATILLLEDGKYKPKKIIYVYFHKKSFILKCISPVLLEEYDNDKELNQGIAEMSSLVDDFIAGKKNLIHYKVEQKDILVEFVEREIHQTIVFKEIDLLKASRISFIKYDSWVDIKYNRKKKEIIIYRKGELGIDGLYFTKKNDRTVLLLFLEVEYNPRYVEFKNVGLPKEFDIYCFKQEENRFSYKEIS